MKTHNNSIDRFIEHNPAHKYLIKRVEEAALQVEAFNSFKILGFIDQHQAKIVEDGMNHFTDVNYTLFSKIIDSERKLLIISTTKLSNKDLAATTALLKIEYNDKFTQLNHRDILGSILNSNIEQRLIGDIVKNDNQFYIEISSTIQDYLINNVDKIKNSKVTFIEIDEAIKRVDHFKNKLHIISSARLDVVVKAITKLSRSDAKNYILQNNVKINQSASDDYALKINDGDVLSLKGYGRFLINFKANKTKKKHIVMIEQKYN